MVEPDVVVVPAGDALLGDPPRTEHVNVFAVARHPVSVADYGAFLDETHHAAPRNWEAQRAHGEAPVEDVSWADAVAYCRWLTMGTGRIYRLPDEREWTNSWAEGGRVLRRGDDLAARSFAGEDLRGVGFRVVRGLTGR